MDHRLHMFALGAVVAAAATVTPPAFAGWKPQVEIAVVLDTASVPSVLLPLNSECATLTDDAKSQMENEYGFIEWIPVTLDAEQALAPFPGHRVIMMVVGDSGQGLGSVRLTTWAITGGDIRFGKRAFSPESLFEDSTSIKSTFAERKTQFISAGKEAIANAIKVNTDTWDDVFGLLPIAEQVIASSQEKMLVLPIPMEELQAAKASIIKITLTVPPDQGVIGANPDPDAKLAAHHGRQGCRPATFSFRDVTEPNWDDIETAIDGSQSVRVYMKHFERYTPEIFWDVD